MAEFKTAEHYVVAKLQELEDKLYQEQLKSNELARSLNEANSVLDAITEMLCLNVNMDGIKTIKLDLWETYDHENFDYLVDRLNLDFADVENGGADR